MDETSGMNLRKKLRVVHKWLGLWLVLLFMLQAVTGILLIYREDIVHQFDPVAEDDSMAAGNAAALDRAIELVQTHYPGWTIRRIDFPHEPTPYLLARLRGTEGQEKRTRVQLGTNEVVPEPFMARVMQTLFDLHAHLLAGGLGAYIVGVLGVAMLLSTVSGLVIGWPGRRKFFHAFKVTFGKPVKTLFELHRATGMFSVLLVPLLAITGALLVFGPDIKPFFGVSVPATISLPRDQDVMPNAILLSRAQRELPGATLRNVRFLPGEVIYRAVFHETTRGASGPSSQVWLDPVTGHVTAVKGADNSSAVETFFAWMYPLHVDLALGRWGQLASLLGGLSVLILSVSGWLFWLKRKGKKKVRRKAHQREVTCV